MSVPASVLFSREKDESWFFVSTVFILCYTILNYRILEIFTAQLRICIPSSHPSVNRQSVSKRTFEIAFFWLFERRRLISVSSFDVDPPRSSLS